MAKLEVFHIASVAHQSSYKYASKAIGDGFIKKSADSADCHLLVANLEDFHIASVAYQLSIKLQISTASKSLYRPNFVNYRPFKY